MWIGKIELSVSTCSYEDLCERVVRRPFTITDIHTSEEKIEM